MFKRLLAPAAIALAVMTSAYPQSSFAEIFKSAEFLKWPAKSQSFYFRTSIGMAGLVARRNNKVQGDCIDNWYFYAEKKAHAHIIDVMRKHPSYHPRGVILAVLEKQCGKLIYTKP